MKEIHHIVLLLLVILVSVYGKFLVLGPDDPVVATAGEDVLLECQLVPDLSVSNMVIQWIKSDLDSPVHIYRNGEDDIVAQHKNYQGRTELFKDELTTGNIALRIKNITIFDEGTYICLVDDKTDSANFAVRLEVIGKFLVLGPDDPVVATPGEDVLLECQLVPDISVSNMEVQWIKSDLDSPVHMYRNGEDDIVAQHKDYRGRTELFKDELTTGNISLRIKNTTIFDEGTYTCLVDDKTYPANFTVGLQVIGLGCEPWIQMKGYHKNGIELVCKSSGWYPEPEILWIGEDGRSLTQAETRYQDSKGLVDVQSNIVVTRQSTNRFKCLILNRQLKTEQEVTIRISDDIFPAVPVWLVPLLVSICLLIAAILVVIYWNVKQHRRIKELELWKSIIEFDQWKPLVESEWKRICECEAPVTLDPNTAHPYLLLSEDLKTVRNTGKRQKLPDNPERFNYYVFVLGSEGFTSGKHSWEVEVGNKTRWSVGVAKESINRKDEIDLFPGNGFWRVRLREGNKYRACEKPRKHLELRVNPRKIRVCLDYEGGKVSFYNSDNKSHIYTFTGTFTEKLYPFFSPGTTDGGKNTEPLKICPRTVTIQEDEGFIP
ncbi:butyrophilin subfamily 3 member A1-like [Heterodontus francisci]|uniref:butyrophilin subfamily 3 member A1-like n=1 Tax=Heterodontus francisci TaxID=7792 RepID=UPI00355B27CE